ncbi:MAG: dihydropteroate synthase [Pseudomonadota bacterium]
MTASGGAYYRPLAIPPRDAPQEALPLAGTGARWTHAERLSRSAPPQVLPAAAVPAPLRDTICAPRPDLAGVPLDTPRLMGILNVTPDSFSDGGRHFDPSRAMAQARALQEAGAAILDIGGESTRPGASPVPADEEIVRTAPVISALAEADFAAPISIDTRNAPVAEAAFDAGAAILNDVSALTHDPAMADLAARAGAPVCLMHAQGTPETMQKNPRYGDVLLDVYDALAARRDAALAAGVAPGQIVLDPGIGFGKTQGHNMALCAGLSLFHGLGCPVMLGVSRKGFIGVIGDAPIAADRAPGSVALALDAVRQGVHILRVHDVAAHRQALALWQALGGGHP